ncbi:MAG: CopG family transcriptional regulator [Candidatus Aminicenantes bacterium]|jgi:hypothetical protein|nr:CopG family transcriptional regulator [Candidatus Aminicenantes bacterium]
MSKTISLSLDDMLYEKFMVYARMDNRSLSNFFKTAAAHYIADKIMMDDFEMEEIRNNIDLRERIRAGSQNAANREGRFVD